jgi:hypothetical protein
VSTPEACSVADGVKRHYQQYLCQATQLLLAATMFHNCSAMQLGTLTMWCGNGAPLLHFLLALCLIVLLANELRSVVDASLFIDLLPGLFFLPWPVQLAEERGQQWQARWFEQCPDMEVLPGEESAEAVPFWCWNGKYSQHCREGMPAGNDSWQGEDKSCCRYFRSCVGTSINQLSAALTGHLS